MFRTMMFPEFSIALCRVPRVRTISHTPVIRCAAGEDGRKKTSSRLSQVQQILHEAQERAKSAGNDPIPKITLGTTFLSSLYVRVFYSSLYYLIEPSKAV